MVVKLSFSDVNFMHPIFVLKWLTVKWAADWSLSTMAIKFPIELWRRMWFAIAIVDAIALDFNLADKTMATTFVFVGGVSFLQLLLYFAIHSDRRH